MPGRWCSALQSGTIDAQENAADTIVGANLSEVQSCLACTNHILYANQICINKASWDALNPAYQSALEQAVTEAMAEMRTQLSDIDREENCGAVQYDAEIKASARGQ